MREAFPALAQVVYDTESEEVPAEVVRRAAAEDIEAQARAVEGTGITLGEDRELMRTQRRCFHRVGVSSFQEVEVNSVNDFCCGRSSLKPDENDLVHLAFIAVAYERNRPVSAHLRGALALRVDEHGVVVKAHRAGAYRGEDESEREPLRDRRNKAMRWGPSGQDWRSLERTIGCDIAIQVP